MLENLATLIGAWLFFLLMNARSLNTLVKKDEQRKQDEKQAVSEGLQRVVALEFFLLVPASAGLVILLMPFLVNLVTGLSALNHGTAEQRVALHTMMGIISYGFPFRQLRERLVGKVMQETGLALEGQAEAGPAVAVQRRGGRAR